MRRSRRLPLQPNIHEATYFDGKVAPDSAHSSERQRALPQSVATVASSQEEIPPSHGRSRGEWLARYGEERQRVSNSKTAAQSRSG